MPGSVASGTHIGNCVCVGVCWGGGWQGVCCNHTRTHLNSEVILFIYALHLFVVD